MTEAEQQEYLNERCKRIQKGRLTVCDRGIVHVAIIKLTSNLPRKRPCGVAGKLVCLESSLMGKHGLYKEQRTH